MRRHHPVQPPEAPASGVALAPHIADCRSAAPLSQGQLLALARQFFIAYDRMAGVPLPG